MREADPVRDRISPRAFAAPAELVGDYFIAVAERVYGDAAATTRDIDTAALKRGGAHSASAAINPITSLAQLPARSAPPRKYLSRTAGCFRRCPNTGFGPRAQLSYLVNTAPARRCRRTGVSGNSEPAAPQCLNLSTVSLRVALARWRRAIISRHAQVVRLPLISLGFFSDASSGGQVLIIALSRGRSYCL